jgi:hypothetical protein
MRHLKTLRAQAGIWQACHWRESLFPSRTNTSKSRRMVSFSVVLLRSGSSDDARLSHQILPPAGHLPRGKEGMLALSSHVRGVGGRSDGDDLLLHDLKRARQGRPSGSSWRRTGRARTRDVGIDSGSTLTLGRKGEQRTLKCRHMLAIRSLLKVLGEKEDTN